MVKTYNRMCRRCDKSFEAPGRHFSICSKCSRARNLKRKNYLGVVK